jgi:hypothetical protein
MASLTLRVGISCVIPRRVKNNYHGKGGLPDDAAVAPSKPGYGQPEDDGLAAERHGANGAFDDSVADSG